MIRRYVIFAFLLIIFYLPACQSANNGNSDNLKLTEKKWVLFRLNKQEIEKSQYSGEKPYVIFNTNANEFSGHGGCNKIFGKYHTGHDTLQFLGIASTKMFCSDENIETKFLQTLKRGITFLIEANSLHIYDSTKTEILEFKPAGK